MLLKEKIKQTKLTRVEQDICDYILDHINDLSKLSTRDIAKDVYCSSSALIRLSKKLGYEGYNEFKDALLFENDYLNAHFESIDANIPFTLDDSMMSVTGRIAKIKQEAINDTQSLIDHDTLQYATMKLNQAKHIYVFGYSAYVSLATIFQLKMSRIHKHVVVCHSIGEMNYQAGMLDSNDVAILVSYSGENKELMQVASILRKHHIPYIIMTSVGDNTLSKDAKCILRIATREKLFSKIANYISEESVSYLFDVLYSCLFRLNYQKNLEDKINYSKEVEFEHFSTNEFMND